MRPVQVFISKRQGRKLILFFVAATVIGASVQIGFLKLGGNTTGRLETVEGSSFPVKTIGWSEKNLEYLQKLRYKTPSSMKGPLPKQDTNSASNYKRPMNATKETVKQTTRLQAVTKPHERLLDNVGRTSKNITSVGALQKPRKKSNRIRYRVFQWTTQPSKDVGPARFKMCREYTNCELSTNINSSDAVLFYIRKLPAEVRSGLAGFRGFRNYSQRWILELLESPVHTYTNLTIYNGMFNATVSYSLKTDIQDKRLSLEKLEDTPANETLAISKKTKLVAWIVSNCETNGKREKFVQVLRRYIPVDVYGKCGNLTCPKSITWDRGIAEDECLKMIEENYKFYLSFENSICRDYFTEKVINILKVNVVPVVLGGADYRRVLPQGSFINVNDFPSVKALAEHLQKLDRDDKSYRSHFEWKKTLNARQSRNVFCATCRYLNENKTPTHVANNLDKVWDKETDCMKPETYYSTFEEIIL